jgi:glycosyltransferase involved in cell wall biosynthesis
MLSVIIASYKDPLLNKTIDDILAKAEGEVEIIPVLDGYFQEVRNDPRVHPIHLHKNGGMKNAINTGRRMARGEYVMRLDEHCMFAQGFDKILTQMEDNWVVVPRRYFLDVDKWEVMDIPPVDYEKLIIDEDHNKFSGVRWTKRAEERKDIPVDETMMMQGSCVVMKKTWWDTVIGELTTEGYGPHYQDQTEIAFKTWKAGGKLMVNKNTWYAHKHRDFPRTHHLSHDAAAPGWAFSLSLWRDYYEQEIKPRFA